MYYLIFWLCLVLLVLATVGYPCLLWVAARVKARPVHKNSQYRPRLSVVVACRNEEAHISRKIQNLLALDYPADRLEIVLVSDGATDRTEVIVDLLLPHPQLQLVALPQAQGLAQAWNAGVAAATGEVVVFTDARQLLKPDSLQALAANLADATVGGVTGARLATTAKAPSPGKKIKKVKLKELIRQLRYRVKTWETQLHSVTEANEALLACRKELFRPLPADFVLPGLAVLLQVVQQGLRVVFEPQALVYDTARYPLRVEIERYYRIFTGYFQYLLDRRLALPRGGQPIWWQLLLHNWIRVSFPLLFLLLFISNLFIADGWFYYFTMLAQLLVLGLCLFGIALRKPLLFYLASRFNVLVLQSFYAFLTRSSRQPGH